jgi:hypothetical protein
MEIAIFIPSIKKLDYIDTWGHVSPKKRVKSLFELIRNRYHQIVVKALENLTPKPKLSHIYFGNEFCQKLIPSVSDVQKAFNTAISRELKFCLVTPYVTNGGLKRLDSLLKILNDQSTDCEIIVNDYGVLDLVRKEYKNLTPVLGRIMDKQDREPRNREIGNIKQIVKRDTQFNVPAYKNFLKASRAQRVEFDNSPSFKSLDLTKLETNASVYVPYGYITTGRICMMGSLHQPIKTKFRVNGKCEKECQLFSSFLYSPCLSKEQKLIGRGNTVFFINEIHQLNEVIKNHQQLGVNRLVFQPEIPM